MTEQPDSVLGTARDRQAALAARFRNAAEADRTLTVAIDQAHEAAVDARLRLESLSDEIEAHRRKLDSGERPDSGLTARELQRRVIDKNREAADIVAAARRDAADKAALLRSLHSQYRG